MTDRGRKTRPGPEQPQSLTPLQDVTSFKLSLANLNDPVSANSVLIARYHRRFTCGDSRKKLEEMSEGEKKMCAAVAKAYWQALKKDHASPAQIKQKTFCSLEALEWIAQVDAASRC